MVTAAIAGACLIPLWILVPKIARDRNRRLPDAVHGAGRLGHHPGAPQRAFSRSIRGFFPGFAYQTGVLFASGVAYVESLLAERFTYTQALGFTMLTLFAFAAIVIALGPEKKGLSFTDPGQGGGRHSPDTEFSATV